VVDEVSASDIIPESSSERAERYRKDQKGKQKYIWTTKGMGEDFFTFLGKNQEKCTNREHLYRLGGCLHLLTLSCPLKVEYDLSYFIVLYLAAKNFENFLKIQNPPKVKNSNHISVNVLSWAYQCRITFRLI
jgi:hypothetical protein